MPPPLPEESSAIECAAIVAALRTTRKYGSLAEDALVRAARAALRTRPKRLADAVHYAREKLHQWCGAYRDLDLARIEKEIAALDFHSDAAVRALATRVLALHASTSERLEAMAEIYRELFLVLGPVSSIVDLAGGAHAFALPWMDLPPETPYRAIDIDGRLARLADEWLMGLSRRGGATCGDVLAELPPLDFAPESVAWLFKAAPCLERQEDGSTLRLLAALAARGCSRAVLSFPTRSLGGREKGMRENYAEWMERVRIALARDVRRLDFDSETFYVIDLLAESRG